MHQRCVIGLASGSSADGIDAALLDLGGVGLDLRLRRVTGLHQPHPPDLRELIRRITGAGPAEVDERPSPSSRWRSSLGQVGRLHRLLGETFAGAARAVAEQASLSLQKVLCVGCTGHLVNHEVESRFSSTLSLGMAGVLAERTGVTTISDFRDRDLAAGGLAVPLAALPDFILFRHARESRLLLHLGRAARLVYLPAGGRLNEMSGFEAGPCNDLLDTLMRQVTAGREDFDTGGKHAVQGRCLEPFVQTWLAHPYFQRRPPRCLPLNAFSDEFATQAILHIRQQGGSLHDVLCSATHFIARATAGAVGRFVHPRRIDRVLLSGGGARNGLLWHLLEQQFATVPLTRTDEVGVPGDFRKAIASAVLASLTLDGVPGNAPATTGAAGSRLLGSLVPGSSANWARCLAWMTAHSLPTPPAGE